MSNLGGTVKRVRFSVRIEGWTENTTSLRNGAIENVRLMAEAGVDIERFILAIGDSEEQEKAVS